MKSDPFHVGDKVTLTERGIAEYASNAVRPGAVYCVEAVKPCRHVQLISLLGVPAPPAARVWQMGHYFRLVNRSRATAEAEPEHARKEADHRCQGTAVLRDVAPHKVPYTITGGQVVDLDADLVSLMEAVAKKRGRTFAREFGEALQRIVEKGYGKELGQ